MKAPGPPGGEFAPELEALDQLAGETLPLVIVRRVFPNDERFLQGVHGLLAEGDVRLLDPGGAEVPRWRWRELFLEGRVLDDLPDFFLELTEQGARKV